MRGNQKHLSKEHLKKRFWGKKERRRRKKKEKQKQKQKKTDSYLLSGCGITKMLLNTEINWQAKADSTERGSELLLSTEASQEYGGIQQEWTKPIRD